MGGMLWVDLTRGTLGEERLPAAVYARQLSGLGLAVGQLLDPDPLGPDNILSFVSGLRTGCGM